MESKFYTEIVVRLVRSLYSFIKIKSMYIHTYIHTYYKRYKYKSITKVANLTNLTFLPVLLDKNAFFDTFRAYNIRFLNEFKDKSMCIEYAHTKLRGVLK